MLVLAVLGMLGLAASPSPAGATTGDLVITGVIDGPLTGGIPKAVELYVANDIPDLSIYGVESANNGGPSAGPEFTFPAVAASAGDHIYVASEMPSFQAFFGVPADFGPTSAVSINGDDAIVLWQDGTAVDVFGEVGTSGTGTAWDYLDGWAYRDDGTGQSPTFDPGEWTFSGTNALDGATTNAGAASPFPLGTYVPEDGDPDPDPDPEVPTSVAIHDVQGPGPASPLIGQLVEVQGVVVGDFQTGAAGEDGSLGGFHLQEADADADADPATSEGVFVAHTATDVAVGDLVTVTGRVAESFSLTQIGSATVTVDAQGVALPSPAAITLPDDLADPVVDWEAVEGMLASLDQPLAATEQFTHGQFGEVVLSAIGAQDHPNQIGLPGSAEADATALLNARSRIQLDDGRTTTNPAPTPYLGADGTLRDGDVVDELDGVVHFAFGDYEIHPVADVEFTRVNDRPDPPTVGGSLQVASFNVLNYFTTTGSRGADDPAELERQAAKIVAALDELDADVVGLIEIENNAPVAVEDLLGRLNAVSDRTYAAVPTGPIGTDVIAVAFIYDTATVELVGEAQILDSSVSPAFLDEENRPALAQTFREIATGGELTAAINHLKSKGSACTTTSNPGDPAYGVAPYAADPEVPADRTGNCNLTRTAAAQVLGQWLEEIDTTGNTLILGDLNAYANEDPIRTLESLGYVDTVETFAGGNTWDLGAYSYVFDGEHGTLDYAMADADLMGVVTGASPWHINADEPPALDYNDWNPPANFQPDPYRSSDHDPIVVGIAFPEPAPLVACQGLELDLAGWQEWADDNGYLLVAGTDDGDLLGALWPGRPRLFLGLDGSDVILGTVRGDVICAGDGDDLVLGGNGDDHIEGGDGNDVLLGGNGRDTIRGGEGDDVLLGGNGADDLDGGPGNNLVL